MTQQPLSVHDEGFEHPPLASAVLHGEGASRKHPQHYVELLWSARNWSSGTSPLRNAPNVRAI
jgi:hypothetical protein